MEKVFIVTEVNRMVEENTLNEYLKESRGEIRMTFPCGGGIAFVVKDPEPDKNSILENAMLFLPEKVPYRGKDYHFTMLRNNFCYTRQSETGFISIAPFEELEERKELVSFNEQLRSYANSLKKRW